MNSLYLTFLFTQLMGLYFFIWDNIENMEKAVKQNRKRNVWAMPNCFFFKYFSSLHSTVTLQIYISFGLIWLTEHTKLWLIFLPNYHTLCGPLRCFFWKPRTGPCQNPFSQVYDDITSSHVWLAFENCSVT